MKTEEKLTASEYLDDWGIINEQNEIIVPISDNFPLSKEMAKMIAKRFNVHDELVRIVESLLVCEHYGFCYCRRGAKEFLRLLDVEKARTK